MWLLLEVILVTILLLFSISLIAFAVMGSKEKVATRQIIVSALPLLVSVYLLTT